MKLNLTETEYAALASACAMAEAEWEDEPSKRTSLAALNRAWEKIQQDRLGGPQT